MGFLDRLLRGKPPATTAEADRLVLRQLKARRADLTKPRHVIHYLYFAEESTARRAAEELERTGYDTTVAPPDEKIDEWSVRAETHRVVDAATVEAFRASFEQVALEFGGEYDGWEAAAKP